MGVELDPLELPTEVEGPTGAVLDLIEQNLRDQHRPALPDDYARYRLDLTGRLLAHVRNRDRWGSLLLEREAWRQRFPPQQDFFS